MGEAVGEPMHRTDRIFGWTILINPPILIGG